MRQSGLADVLPSLRDTVYVGLSAGSMVMTPRIGQDFVRWRPPTGGDETLGLVDFSIFPHLDNPALPENTLAAQNGGPPACRSRRPRSTMRPPFA
jgi:dipeptidase E